MGGDDEDLKNRVIQVAMKANGTALILALVAGLLCLAASAIHYYRHGDLDYKMLFAGIFVLAFGISMNYRRKAS